jgi:hypothetical protein
MSQVSQFTHPHETGMGIYMVPIPEAAGVGVPERVGDQFDGCRCVRYEDQIEFVWVRIEELKHAESNVIRSLR